MAATIALLLSLLILGDAQQVLKLQNPRLMNCRFDKIYQFGDSISDTGNCIRETLCEAQSWCKRPPYGINFYQNVTGRCSNGMLIIDFIGINSYFASPTVLLYIERERARAILLLHFHL